MSDREPHDHDPPRPPAGLGDPLTMPDSPLIHLWNAIIVVGGTTMAVFVPLDLVLGVRETRGARELVVVITAIFLIDIGVSIYRFRGTRSEAGFIAAPGTPAYFRRWLLVDAIAAVPWGSLAGLGWLDILRLVKLDKVRSIMAEWKLRELRYADELLLAFVLYTMTLATHWIACGWIALRGVAEQSPARETYVDALYWTITTLTTVGYGDVTPATPPKSSSPSAR